MENKYTANESLYIIQETDEERVFTDRNEANLVAFDIWLATGSLTSVVHAVYEPERVSDPDDIDVDWTSYFRVLDTDGCFNAFHLRGKKRYRCRVCGGAGLRKNERYVVGDVAAFDIHDDGGATIDVDVYSREQAYSCPTLYEAMTRLGLGDSIDMAFDGGAIAYGPQAPQVSIRLLELSGVYVYEVGCAEYYFATRQGEPFVMYDCTGKAVPLDCFEVVDGHLVRVEALASDGKPLRSRGCGKLCREDYFLPPEVVKDLIERLGLPESLEAQRLRAQGIEMELNKRRNNQEAN
nr:MAG TPA: hypothetical protein [Caudoviricetes sp.]